MNRLLSTFIFTAIAFWATMGVLPASDLNDPGQQTETKTITVQEAVRMALARSPEILLAEAQVIRAREAVRETRSLNRPQVYTGTGLAYNNGYPLSMEGAAPSIFQISGSQAIFSKKNSNLVREAEESGKASRFGADSVRNELASRTALTYYQFYKSRQEIQIASQRLDQAQKEQEQVEALSAAGRIRPIDVKLAEAAVRSARRQLTIFQEQANLAETELRELTGFSGSVFINIVEPQIDNPIFKMQGLALYQQALECTPEVLQAQANARAKELHVEAEKGERLPKAQIVGEYALFSKTNKYEDYFNRFSRNNYIIGLSLQVPIFDGFRVSSRVAQSRQEASESRYRLESAKSDLKLNIERGLSALKIAQVDSDYAQSDADDARETVKVNEALLEAGRISSKEMAEFRSMLDQKELAQLEANQVLFQRKLELLRITGSIASAF